MVGEDPVPFLSGSLGFFSSTCGLYPQDDISILNLNHRHTILRGRKGNALSYG